MTVTTGGGSGVNGFLSGSPGGEYSLLTSIFKLCAFSHFRLPTSGGLSNYVVGWRSWYKQFSELSQ